MDIPNTPAGQRLRWLIEHTGEGNAELHEVVDQFEPAFIEHVGIEPVVGFLEQSTYLQTAAVVEAREAKGAVAVKFRVEDDHVVVQVVVSDEPPQRIAGLMVKTGPTQIEALDETPGSDASVAEVIQQHIAPFAAQLRGGGLVVGVSRDGERTVGAFGNAPADGIYDVGSITKPFTAILLAEMARRGVVSLDNPVSKHLPSGVLSHPITLEQLATHTSGLPRLPANFRPADNTDPYADYTPDKMYDALRTIELDAEPGTRSTYSNFGYSLLGHVLELAGGRPYEDLLNDLVCRPLSLASTRAAETEPDGVVGGYKGGRKTPWWSEAILGAGGVSSTIDDLLSFAEANLHPTSTAIAEALTRAQRVRIDESDRTHVCLGWHVIDRRDGSPVVWHNGGTGGFRSFTAFHPASGTAIAALSNNGDADPDVPVISTLAALLNAP